MVYGINIIIITYLHVLGMKRVSCLKVLLSNSTLVNGKWHID